MGTDIKIGHKIAVGLPKELHAITCDPEVIGYEQRGGKTLL